MLAAGLYSVFELASIQARNDEIRANFLKRNSLLNQIRADLYLSGTYVRDYLLDLDPQRTIRNRDSLESSRLKIRNNLTAYRSVLTPRELKPISGLISELDRYWASIDPVLKWSAEERQRRGYAFLRDEIFPRRTVMLNVAEEIGHLNERQLTDGDLQVSNLFLDFRRSLSVVLGICLSLGLLMAAYIIHGVLALERQAAQRYSEVVDARRELKDLSARLVELQEQERRTISRELHDEVGQSLTALLVGLSNLWASVSQYASVSPHAVAALKDEFAAIRRLAEDSVNAVRNMALLLRPSMLDDLGLIPALQWQAREVSRRTGMRVSVTAEQVSDELPESHKTCVYRLVQEALHNSSRHAAAQSIFIRVRQEAGCLRISIQDDGKGFCVDDAKGLGLLGMQERVATLKGLFEVDSRPGRGTLLTATLPLTDKEDKESETT
jgi:signal transduction histidine kinase